MERCQCGLGHCQATFSDRSNAWHVTRFCRDCKRARGREAASASQSGWHQTQQDDSWNQSGWEDTAWGQNWGGRPLVVPMSPPPAFTGIAHFWAATSTSLCCPAWTGGTQPAAFSITTLEHPLPAEKMSFSAGRLGCLGVQFCQAPLHLDKNTCMPAWSSKRFVFYWGGTAPAGPGCLGTEASTFPHSPQTHTVRTLSNTPRILSSPWVSVSTCRVMPMPGRMSDFTQLALECNVPATIVALLGSFDASLLARSGTSVQEQEDFITHFIDAASITDVAERFLARASLRLLYSKCRHAEGVPSLESPPAVPPLGAPGSGSGTGGPTPPPISSTWQESWPAKLSPEKTLSLRKRFEEDYPTELLDSECFPSARLLALSRKMLAEKEHKWLPWRFRLSSKSQEDTLLVRPRKQARFSELSELLLDEAPSRDIHEGPASYSLISQLLTLAANAIALCQGAHLGSLKLYNKKFLRLCFTKYEASSSLRGPTVMEAQAADKRCWELISDLVNQHNWKLDDALYEVCEVGSDMSSLLAPRPFINKKLLETQLGGRDSPASPGGAKVRAKAAKDVAISTTSQTGWNAARARKVNPLRPRASGFRPSSWRASATHFACAFKVANARTLPLAATSTAVPCPKQMVPLAGAITQHLNMLLPRTRKPASTNSGTSSKRSRVFRFVYQLNRQVPLEPLWNFRRRNPQYHRLRWPSAKATWTSPLAWSFW